MASGLVSLLARSSRFDFRDSCDNSEKRYTRYSTAASGSPFIGMPSDATSDREVGDLLKILIHIEHAEETANALPDVDGEGEDTAAVVSESSIGVVIDSPTGRQANAPSKPRGSSSGTDGQQDEPVSPQRQRQLRQEKKRQQRQRQLEERKHQQPDKSKKRDIQVEQTKQSQPEEKRKERDLEAIAAPPLKPPALSGRLLKAKQLYRTVKPKLEEWGLPVDELNRDLTDAVYAEFFKPVEELYDLLTSSIGAGKQVINDIDGAKDGVSRAVADFNMSIPIEDLTLHLPAKVMSLSDMVVAGLKEPKLLAPTFNKSLIPKNKYTELLDVDSMVQTAMQQVYQHQGAISATLEAAAASSDTRSSRNRDSVGASSRTQSWKQLETSLHDVAEPLLEVLEELRGVAPEVQGLSARAFGPVEGALVSLAELCRQAAALREQSRSLVDPLVCGDEAEARAAGANEHGDVFETMGKALAVSMQIRGMKDAVCGSIQQVQGSLGIFDEMFSLLRKVALALAAVDWSRISGGMRGLAGHYPQLLSTARSILKPEGLAACVMQPSPYLAQLESKVEDVRSCVDLGACGYRLQEGVRKTLSVLGMDLDQVQQATMTSAEGGGIRDGGREEEGRGGDVVDDGWSGVRGGVETMTGLSRAVQEKIAAVGSKEPQEVMEEMGAKANGVLVAWMGKVKAQVAAAAKAKAEEMGAELLGDSLDSIGLPASLSDLALSELGTDNAAEVGNKVSSFLGSFM